MTPTRAFHTGLLVGAGMLTGLVAASLRAGAATSQLPRASLGETLSFFTRVLAPVIAKGVIVRRPRVLALAEFLDLDARAVRVLQRLRHEHPVGPLMLGPLGGRRFALILHPDHVRRVLFDTPEPFATATPEKRAALSHFEPKTALISHGADRADRRRFNEQALDHRQSMHRLAASFAGIVQDEASRLLAASGRRGELTWNNFAPAWFRMVRRIVFGDGAADDHELSRIMARLRTHANWAFLSPQRRGLRNRLFECLDEHLARAEPGSLAGVIAAMPKTNRTAPAHQIPQWLFAFDPAGMATFRTLALLSSHPAQAQRARAEIASSSDAVVAELPYLRACVLESLRLWPTTPLVLRESLEETWWGEHSMPARTGVIIFAPFFYRDEQRMRFAHTFSPDVWLQGRPDEEWPLVPFSLGPATCPARNLVLLVSSVMLASILGRREVQMHPPARLDPHTPLPGTLSHFSLRFELAARDVLA
jgi:cytochrome P450